MADNSKIGLSTSLSTSLNKPSASLSMRLTQTGNKITA